jgi:hypothetical protein
MALMPAMCGYNKRAMKCKAPSRERQADDRGHGVGGADRGAAINGACGEADPELTLAGWLAGSAAVPFRLTTGRDRSRA